MKKLLIFCILLIAAPLQAQTTYTWWTGFEGGTNGVAPTTASLASGTHGDTGGSSNWSIGGLGVGGLLYATAAQLSNYPSNITVSSTNYNGSGSLGLQCTTTTMGPGNCGFVDRQFSAAVSSAAAAFYIKWSCPSTAFLDCGALGGLFTFPSGKYAVIHVETGSTGGMQSMYLETSGGVMSSPIAVSPNTVYLINLQQNGGTGNSDFLTVCNAAGTSVVGSISNGNGITDSNEPGYFYTGVTGEEPTTAGYTYEWDDVAVDMTGANFSATGCFPPGSSSANAPTFSPVAGNYVGPKTVTLSTSSGGAIICYNTSGSPATNGSSGCTTGTLYSSPITVSSTETVYAVAGGTGFTDSTISSAAYALAAPACTGASCVALSCSSYDVDNALPTSGNANTSVTVTIPAGSCTWIDNLSYTQPSGVSYLTLTGTGTMNQGTGTFGAVAGSTTLISNAGSTNPILNINVSYPQTLKLYSLNILPFSTMTTLSTPVWVLGTCTSSGCPNFRASNLNFGNGTIQWTDAGNGFQSSTMMALDNVYGVADHNTMPSGSDDRLVDVQHSAWLGVGQYGDNSWAQPDSFGTASAFYVENNSFHSATWPFVDSESQPENAGSNRGGGRIVVRYNQITTGGGIACTNHGTEASSGRARGGRQMECYGNVMTCTSGCPQGISFLRSGAELQFNNEAIVSGGTFGTYINIYEARRSSGPQTPYLWGSGTGPYDQNTGTVFASGITTGGSMSSLSDSTKSWTTNQWQLAGAPYSAWDVTASCGLEILSNTATTLTLMNASSSCTIGTGDSYQILQATVLIDQPTRGAGSYISGTASPGSGPSPTGFPSNALDPIYQWNDTTSGGTTSTNVFGDVGDISFLANRDYYAQASGIQTTSSSPFNGTSNTGWGTLANRPSTCTAGVGYFATNSGSQGTMYVCAMTNTWSSYYQPYTYPHPLDAPLLVTSGMSNAILRNATIQ